MRNVLVAIVLLSWVSASAADTASPAQVREWQKTLAQERARQTSRHEAAQRVEAELELAQAQANLQEAAMAARQVEGLMRDAMAQAQARLSILQSGYAYGYGYYPADLYGLYYFVYFPDPSRRLSSREAVAEIAREHELLRQLRDALRKMGAQRGQVDSLLGRASAQRGSASRQNAGAQSSAGRQPQGQNTLGHQATLAAIQARIQQINGLAQAMGALRREVAAHPVVTAQMTIQRTMIQHAAASHAAAMGHAGGTSHHGGGMSSSHAGSQFGGGGSHWGGFGAGHGGGGRR
jgi:hypothetical protein